MTTHSPTRGSPDSASWSDVSAWEGPSIRSALRGVGVANGWDPSSDLERVFERVAWNGGASCAEVAELLAAVTAVRVEGDLRRFCVGARIDALVTPRLGSLDLIPTVVPYEVALDDIQAVTAAVDGGPHCDLAVAVATRVAGGLGVPATVATVYRSHDEIPGVLDRLAEIGAAGLDVGRLALSGPSVLEFLDSLDRYSLLVVGAPGGSWLQRHLFGKGYRLAARAPGGVLVVRTEPRPVESNGASR